jgi:hypothetical protein
MSSLRGLKAAALALAVVLSAAAPGHAWPNAAYRQIFLEARKALPEPLQQLLADAAPILDQTCGPMGLDEAVDRAIAGFSDEGGDLPGAMDALRDAGCAAAALNDPGMDALVTQQQSRFRVVFYGWHPAIRDGDLGAYIGERQAEIAELAARYERTSQLPNRSEQVEVSPEFGVASVAYSHAVTDVANIWLYIWIAVNGAF